VTLNKLPKYAVLIRWDLPVRPRRAAADLGRGDPDRGAGRREAVGVLRGAGPRLQGARRSHNDTLWKDLGGSISP